MSEVEKLQNKNAPIEKQVYKFYPHYCKKRGHNSANAKQCDIHEKTAVEKKAAMDAINALVLSKDVARVKAQSKFSMFPTLLIIFSMIILSCTVNTYK